MAGCSTASIGFGAIGCIGMCVKYLVRGVTSNFGIGVSVEIIKKMFGVFDCLFGGLCLSTAEC